MINRINVVSVPKMLESPDDRKMMQSVKQKWLIAARAVECPDVDGYLEYLTIALSKKEVQYKTMQDALTLAYNALEHYTSKLWQNALEEYAAATAKAETANVLNAKVVSEKGAKNAAERKEVM
jgi:hypothetical protein